MVSEDMKGLLGTMEAVTAPGPVGLKDANGHEISCTGIINFSMKFAMLNEMESAGPCQVMAWVTPKLRDKFIVGSTTLADLGFPRVEDIPVGVLFYMTPQP